jgi:crossover junction endodeoxyribonuclease RuvC
MKNVTEKTMRVVAADPGYDRFGVAVLEKKDGQDGLLFSDCLKTNAKDDFHQRLADIGQGYLKIIKKWKPEILAIEKLFLTKNQKTATNIAEVRGMIIYLSVVNKIKIMEFTPLEIKMCTAGYGQADKKQVSEMVKNILKISKNIKYDDEYDAIASGLTALARYKLDAYLK